MPSPMKPSMSSLAPAGAGDGGETICAVSLVPSAVMRVVWTASRPALEPTHRTRAAPSGRPSVTSGRDVRRRSRERSGPVRSHRRAGAASTSGPSAPSRRAARCRRRTSRAPVPGPAQASTPPKLPVLPRDAVWSPPADCQASVERPVALIAACTSWTCEGAVATSGSAANSPPATRAAARTLVPANHATTRRAVGRDRHRRRVVEAERRRRADRGPRTGCPPSRSRRARARPAPTR